MAGKVKRATVYVDSQDTSNEGWAWRVSYADGHAESGEADDIVDGINQCAAVDEQVPMDLDQWQVERDGSHVWGS